MLLFGNPATPVLGRFSGIGRRLPEPLDLAHQGLDLLVTGQLTADNLFSLRLDVRTLGNQCAATLRENLQFCFTDYENLVDFHGRWADYGHAPREGRSHFLDDLGGRRFFMD